ncbi:MAG: DUF4397 domain-containing protein [Flavobacterium sp.]|uniref:DUF4397 domain-containing protein n=1 Tax=Flavobacterium sp. TaxID=239 RepID=UPI00263973FD|nr:DUF4397 domain-containing protein [Flavobacterium sp.]MDD5149269.1 DUF4397 domain-containing protein [Flavobacterium sp.]
MKNKIITINKLLATALLTLVLFTSCGDETNFAPYAESIPAANASVKFQHTAVGPAGVNFTVNWSLNDVKTSSVLVTTGLPLGIAYGKQYPDAINYTTVPAGSPNMKVEIPATDTVPASTLFTSPLVLEGGKNYTTFVVGSSPNYSAYTVGDNLTVGDPTKAYVRFLNVISNSPVTGYDLSIKELNSNAVIYSGVNYLGGNTAFIPITPIADLESTTYEVQLRTVGTTTIVAKFTFTPRKGRVYTFYSYGYVGGIPTSTKNIPALTYYTNK